MVERYFPTDSFIRSSCALLNALEETLQLRDATFKKKLFDSALEVELFKGLKRKLSLRAFINCITYEKILNILEVIDQ